MLRLTVHFPLCDYIFRTMLLGAKKLKINDGIFLSNTVGQDVILWSGLFRICVMC